MAIKSLKTIEKELVEDLLRELKEGMLLMSRQKTLLADRIREHVKDAAELEKLLADGEWDPEVIAAYMDKYAGKNEIIPGELSA